MEFHAYHLPNEPTALQHLEVRSPLMDTEEEAKAFASKFPKAAALRVYQQGRMTGEARVVRYGVGAHYNFAPNKATGEVNEAALKKYDALVKATQKHGIEPEWKSNAGNSLSRDQFHQHLPTPQPKRPRRA